MLRSIGKQSGESVESVQEKTWEGSDISRKGAIMGVILGHAQTCPRSIFSTLFARGMSDAASGYQSTVATCCL